MSQALLNHYIVLHVLKDRIDKLDNKEIAKEFIEKNEWHRNYFGQLYRIVGKFGRGSLANLVNCPQFTKLKPSKLVLTVNNLLADLLIRQTFFHQMLEMSQFAKLSPRQTFLLYSNCHCSYAGMYVFNLKS